MAIVKAKDTWGNNTPSAHQLVDVFNKLTPEERQLTLSAVARQAKDREYFGGYRRQGLEIPPAFILRK